MALARSRRGGGRAIRFWVVSPLESTVVRLRTLWNIHRCLGIGAGLLFAVTALTGVLLIWSHELNLREHSELPQGVATGEVSDAVPESLARLVEENPGSRLSIVVLPRGDDTPRAWHAFLRPKGEDVSTIYELDPTTGKVLGSFNADSRWQRWLLDLHYEYLAGTAGAIVAWIVSTALVLLAVSGFWIYRGALRDLFRWRIHGGSSARSAVGWLHRWLGAWSLILALVWGVTGFLYLWFIVPGRFEERKAPTETDPVVFRGVADFSDLFAKARALYPNGEFTSISFSTTRGGDGGVASRVSFRSLHRERWFWEKISRATYDGRSGELVKLQAPGEGTFRQRLFVVMAALHFGSQGGRVEQVIWTAGGLVMFFLPISGYAIWLLRQNRSFAKRRKPGRTRAEDREVAVAAGAAKE